MNGIILVSIPLLPPCYLLAQLLFNHNPCYIIISWLQQFISNHLTVNRNGSATTSESEMKVIVSDDDENELDDPSLGPQLLAFVIVATFGYRATNYLVPIIKVSFMNLHTFH